MGIVLVPVCSGGHFSCGCSTGASVVVVMVVVGVVLVLVFSGGHGSCGCSTDASLWWWSWQL